MNLHTQTEGAGHEPAPFKFALVPAHKPEFYIENVRYALSLNLPQVMPCAAHDGILSIAGGGPSLEDTYKDLTGYVAAINGTLAYLLGKGMKPHMCGICDPTEKIADMIEAVEGVTYFIASCAHRKVFDKLLGAGCDVRLFHVREVEGIEPILTEHYQGQYETIPGGCTMGLRWMTLGYYLGFRKFHLHGMDSSFRDKSSHAYPDHQDAKEWVNFDGFPTRINFIGQVVDFLKLMEDSRFPDTDPIEITMFGEGLLQTRYAHWLKQNPPFEWPNSDVDGRRYIMQESRSIPDFLRLIPKRGTCIQAGGNVGVYPRKLAEYFERVLTFEPDAKNFRCLCKNVEGVKNVTVFNAALGEKRGRVKMASHQDGNAGAVHCEPGDDMVVAPIDAICPEPCDLIWLDIEGYEELALKGAVQTIEKFKPAVIVEEKSILAEMHGLDPTGAVKWLKSRGYYRVLTKGNDNLYVYGGA